MDLVAYQPDIAQNLGSLIRLCACFSSPLHIIEPCGFLLDDKRMRRAAMDYLDLASVTRHVSWQAFLEAKKDRRLLLLTTHGSEDYTGFSFRDDDMLLLGRESAGAPPEVHAAANARLRIDINPLARSLNIAQAAGIVLAEGIRQVKGAGHGK